MGAQVAIVAVPEFSGRLQTVVVATGWKRPTAARSLRSSFRAASPVDEGQRPRAATTWITRRGWSCSRTPGPPDRKAHRIDAAQQLKLFEDLREKLKGLAQAAENVGLSETGFAIYGVLLEPKALKVAEA